MRARCGKIDPAKNRCDRCERTAPVRECEFSFRDGSYAHWKALWQARTGQRLTNRRKERLKQREEDQLDLKALSAVTYYLDLCEGCWQECRAPWEGFPAEFYQQVVLREGALPKL